MIFRKIEAQWKDRDLSPVLLILPVVLSSLKGLSHMCKLFTAWGKEIYEYCKDNGLDFSKAEKSGKCWSPNVLMLQHIDPQKGKNGLQDETPAPVTLIVKKKNGRLMFEQTKHTKRYLVSK